MFTHNNKALLSLALFCFIAFFACNPETTNNKDATQDAEFSLTSEQLESMNISMSVLKKDGIFPVLYATGKVRLLPESKAIITANLSGKVVKIHIVEGQYVKKGQPLFEISSMELVELQQAYLVAKSQMEFLKLEFERQSELRKNNIGSLAEYQKTEAEYRAAINSVEALKEKLKLLGVDMNELDKEQSNVISKLTVRSPIDGSVFRENIFFGQRIDSQSELAEIINLNNLQADLDVFEKDIDLVAEGQSVEIKFLNQQASTTTGKVINILKSIDPESRSIPVFVNFIPPKGANILPEMAVEAKIKGLKKSSLEYTVFKSSLIQEGELFYIILGKKDETSEQRYIFKKVKVFPLDGSELFIQIQINELPSGFTLVVDKNPHLVDAEMKINGY